MIFHSLTIRNFLSFGDRAQTIELDKKGLVLVEGINQDDPNTLSNGAGKSTIIDALVWCLYGVTLRGYDGDEVINRHTGKNCFVALYVDVGEYQYTINRSRKLEYTPTSHLSVAWDRPSQGEFQMDACKSSIRETQEYITQSVLGMTLSTFLNVVVFGQTKQYRFALLNDTEQKELLDNALSLQTYVQGHKKAKATIENLETKKERIDYRLNYAREALKSHKDEKAKHEVSQETFEENKASDAKYWALLVRGMQADLVLIRDPADFTAVRKATEEIQKQFQEVALSMMQAADTFTRIERELYSAEQSQKKFSTLCPTCNQEIQAATKDLWQAKVDSLRTQHKQAKRVLQALQKERDTLLIGKKTFEERLAYEEAQAEQIRAKKAGILAKINEAKAEYKRVKEQESPYKALFAHLDYMIEKEQRTIQGLLKRQIRLVRSIEYFTFWLQAFSTKGIRPLIINTALPDLNALVGEYITELTEGSTKIEFSTQTVLKSGKTAERFYVDVVSKHGASTYQGHSAGEKAKVDLCIGLALQTFVAQKTGISTNVLFFDEVTENLDDAATEKVLALLTRVASKRESVFVITHQESFKALFPSTLTVTKKYGESSVVQ